MSEAWHRRSPEARADQDPLFVPPAEPTHQQSPDDESLASAEMVTPDAIPVPAPVEAGRSGMTTSPPRRPGLSRDPEIVSRGKRHWSMRLQSASGASYFRAIVVSSVLYVSLPSFVDIITAGRLQPTEYQIGGIGTSAFGHSLDLGLRYLTILLGVFTFSLRVSHRKSSPSLLFLYLSFFVLVQASLIDNGASPLPRTPVQIWAALGLGIWAAAPDLRELRIIGECAIVVAVVALVFALISSKAWMYQSLISPGQSKALVGKRLLAGPFGQDNQLGMFMAGGLPFVWLIDKKKIRRFGVLLVATALLLSGSRTSMIAVGVMALVVLLIRAARTRGSQVVAVWVAIAIVVGIVVILPVTTSDPAAYSDRGQIWIYSRIVWPQNWVFGLSPRAYTIDTPLTALIGGVHGHGHNTFVTLMTATGVLGVSLFALIFIVAVVKSTGALGVTAVPAAFMVLLSTISIAETPLRVDAFDGQAATLWIGLIAILLFYTRSGGSSDAALTSNPPLPRARSDGHFVRARPSGAKAPDRQ